MHVIRTGSGEDAGQFVRFDGDAEAARGTGASQRLRDGRRGRVLVLKATTRRAMPYKSTLPASFR